VSGSSTAEAGLMKRAIQRDGSKGNKDRLTMLPTVVKKLLAEHLERSRELHQRDLREGFERVYMPYALEREYPNAARQWGWQYVFLHPIVLSIHKLVFKQGIMSTNQFYNGP